MMRDSSDAPEVIPMAEASTYFQPREQCMHRQFRVESALLLQRADIGA